MPSYDAREKGVFLYDTPNFENLKACALFWNNIVVFESYLSHVVENPDLANITLLLLKNGVLKFSHTPKALRSAIHDKIYYTLDKEVWEFIDHNAEKITIKPTFPANVEEIIKQSTRRDFEDQQLKKLVNEIIYNETKERYLNALYENPRFEFDLVPKELQKEMMDEIQKLVDMEFNYRKKFSNTQNSFRMRNSYFLEQTSVSSALFVPLNWIPYYQYKVGDYSIKDAKRYLQGLDAIMPFVRRKSILDFSLQEILEIRQKKRWNNAMKRLGELCSKITYGTDIKAFRDEVKTSVITEYQDALDEEEITPANLSKGLIKGSVFTGISLIPFIGPLVSAASGFVDPVISYLIKEKKQKNLPFFLNDIRKMPAK
jgi:hypothetical protein